jgi:hypothetical protein
VPAKPTWVSKLDSIIEELSALPRPFVDRSTIELVLGVGRRRAQQIMAACVTDQVGASSLVERAVLIKHLRRVAQGEEVSFELRRRRRVASLIGALRQERIEQPRLLVEAATSVVNQQLASLPTGVSVEVGSITIRFDQPREALEKLLALAMAISNDFEAFETAVTGSTKING